MSKSLRKKIEELEMRNQYIADNLLDAIWVVDAKTLKFEFITPSIEKISGFTAEEFGEFTIQERMTPRSLM